MGQLSLFSRGFPEQKIRNSATVLRRQGKRRRRVLVPRPSALWHSPAGKPAKITVEYVHETGPASIHLDRIFPLSRFSRIEAELPHLTDRIIRYGTAVK